MPSSDIQTVVGRDEAAGDSHMDILDIPFGSIFALQPSSIRYVASILTVTSQLSPQDAQTFGSMFDIRGRDLGQPKALASVGRLAASIGNMSADSLRLIVQASLLAKSDDTLSKTGSLFTLANLLGMDTRRVDEMAVLFDSLSQLPTIDLGHYLQDVGWAAPDTTKDGLVTTDDSSMPDLSYLIPMKDTMLQDLERAAREYPRDGATGFIVAVRPEVEQYLNHARDFWDSIPGYSTVSSLVGLSSSPIVNALTPLVSLLYKYPNASYWELALQYYKDIGMPGLNALSTYPSQYVGAFASTIVGGYVSNAISSVIGNVLGPGLNATPTRASSSSSSSGPTPNIAHTPITTRTPTTTSISSSSGGFRGGVSSISTLPSAVSPQELVPTAVGAIEETALHSPQPTPAPRTAPLQATLDLNLNQSTRIAYTVSAKPDMIILTIIPKTH
ncbi:hypothetical protein GGF46_003222 [Coemansia sp. RSA 552]|nr:hypothetical protein GGF46_003222 [Coemansia sp. RSA 552]